MGDAQKAKTDRSISRHEWVIVLIVALIMAGFTILPYWVGYRAALDGTVFTGAIMNPEDTHTYFAKMLQGFNGRWLYTIVFTPEPHDPLFLGGFYLALGHIARATGLTLDAVWHLARITAVFILTFTTYWFIAWFVSDKKTRTAAYLLTIFGAGLGWLLFAFGQPYWLDWFPVDFKMPSAHFFFALLTYPHIILSTALLLVNFRLLLQAIEAPQQQKSWLYALGAGAANLLITILHPLLTYLFVLIGVLFWLYLTFHKRRFLWREGVLLAISFVPPGVMSLYYGYGLLTNDVLRGWDAQRSGTVSPPWPHYLVAYAPLLILAFLQLWKDRRDGVKRDISWAFLWVWLAAAALLVYAPLNSQRRFIQGVHLPLSILAATAFVGVILPWLLHTRPFQSLLTRPRYTRKKLSRFITAVFILLMSLSNIYVIASLITSNLIQQPDLIFRSQDEADAVAWLRENGDKTAVLLGAYETGNYVAALAGNQVVVGHWAETINYDDKMAETARFYDGQTSDAQRQELLQQYNVVYVWHGPRERELGGFDLETAVYLQPIYKNDTITIYAASTPVGQ